MIRILASDIQKAEVLYKGTGTDIIAWVADFDDLVRTEADVYIDLLFTPGTERITALKNLAKPVVVNSVTDTLLNLDKSFIRLNAWPGFLQRPVVECAGATKENERYASAIFDQLNWQYVILPDEPGFIAARIVAMIINEAYLALGEGVSTKAEIDLAMKMGTNYPFGPFEWAQKIGLPGILQLLSKLEQTHPRYQPSALLIEEVAGLSSTPH